MHIKKELYYSIAIKDAPGALAGITAHLMQAEVNMHGFWGFGMGRGSAQIIAVPDDTEKFVQVAHDAGWQISEGVCFRIEGQDKTGALVDILNQISNEKINLYAVDAIAIDGNFGCYIWGEDGNAESIAQILGLSSPLG
ncbi:MAG: hypothetical protein KDD62_14125 [Bdellovibrionales bacterium]|nr:hypothetical protein [Bdellovibrionales bacterium]